MQPQIPWQDIVNMRNRLVHAYFEINVATVWRTLAEDLSPLAAAAEAIIEAGTAH